jgi:hypothetical protein
MRWVSRAILLSSIALLPGMAGAEIVSDAKVQPGIADDAPRVLVIANRAWVGYFDGHSRLHLDPLDAVDAERGPVGSEGAPEYSNTHIGVTEADGRVYLLSRPKRARPVGGEPVGVKFILFRASQDGGRIFGAPVRLSQGGGAFSPAPLAAGGDGHLYVLWDDEQAQGYGVFFNGSTDYGKTWLPREIRLDAGDRAEGREAETAEQQPASGGYDAFVAATGKTALVAGWLRTGAGGDNDLVLRRSPDGGSRWGREQILPTPEEQIYTPRLLRVGADLIIFYYAPEQGILYTRSGDGGETWSEAAVLPGSLQWGGRGYVFAQDGAERQCMAWPGPNDVSRYRADILASCSQDGGRTWSARPERLDSNTPGLTHSLSPAIAMDPQGRVVVVWRDSRNIRPDTYLRYSLDGGRTWNARDIRVNERPGAAHSGFPSVVATGSGEFVILWQAQRGDGAQKEATFAYERLGLPRARFQSQPDRLLSEPDPSETPDPAARKARLEERIEQFWKARVAADYAQQYALFDPFYRARSNMLEYGSPLSRFEYLDFALDPESIVVSENRATDTVKVHFRGKAPFRVEGREVEIPERRREIHEAWVWVDGDWHKVYRVDNRDYLPL